MSFNIKTTLTVLLALLWLYAPVSAQEPGETIHGEILIDKVAAVVNDQLITLTDIDKAIQFYAGFRKKQESESDFYNRVLEELINYKVVYLEFKNDFVLREEDYETVQTDVIGRIGSLDNLLRLLATFDMGWADFKAFITERVAYERVINRQLQEKISIKFSQIEAFYNSEYLPLQKRLDLTPLSLFDMAPQIEKHLRKERIQKQLAGWLKDIRASYIIENKLAKEKE